MEGGKPLDTFGIAPPQERSDEEAWRSPAKSGGFGSQSTVSLTEPLYLIVEYPFTKSKEGKHNKMSNKIIVN